MSLVRVLPLPRSMVPALFKVACWPAVNGVMLPWVDVMTLLPSTLNSPLPVMLSPSTTLPSTSNREPLLRLTVSQLM
ncbi:hypothetical protein D3C84_577600 [compost metagenome]